MSEYTKLSVNLNQETAYAIRWLKDENELSVTEVIRHAVSLYYYVTRERMRGNNILLEEFGTLYEIEIGETR